MDNIAQEKAIAWGISGKIWDEMLKERGELTKIEEDFRTFLSLFLNVKSQISSLLNNPRGVTSLGTGEYKREATDVGLIRNSLNGLLQDIERMKKLEKEGYTLEKLFKEAERDLRTELRVIEAIAKELRL